ncbi:MAG: twin-arginine translocase TatA/TatE family subunit [Actinomycetales bacterium]|nr:twin-arginine translocase TatA/TatE family subunit [Actinomycetales bacterium]
MRLEGWHLIVVAVIALLLFGGAKLPSIAKNLGQSMRVFRKEIKTLNDEKAAEKAEESKKSESANTDAN